MGKLLFFDIDGTLVGFGGVMPESAIEALTKARENGHLLFISTGRSRSQIYESLMDFGFDGIIAATGGYVEFQGKEVFHNVFGKDNIIKVLDAFEGSDAGLFFQKKDEVITTSRYAEIFLEEFGIEADLDRISETPGLEFVRLDDDLENYPVNHADTESFIYCKAPYPTEVLSRMLAPEIHVETASYKNPEPYSGELTLEINSKATGIEKMLEYLGREREDVIAFGDGANDLEMMEFANVSVAMGNANERVKKRADLVTTDILDDGIKNALERLSLI